MARKRENMVFTKDKSFYKSLFVLSLPIALQNLVTFAVGLTDNVMIGALGDSAVSGVYMGTQIQTVLQVFSGGIEGAISVMSTQYWGKKDTESIRRIAGIGIDLSILFGAVMTLICFFAPGAVMSMFTDKSEIIDMGAAYLKMVCLSYIPFCLTQALISAMRSVETPRVGLYVSLISLGINIALNYALIFGRLGAPRLGVKGAAIATLIARICECAMALIYSLLIDKKLSIRLRDAIISDKRLLWDFLKYGTPIILGQLVWAVNMLSSSAIMGRQGGEGVVTALSIANTLNGLAYVVMNGMAGAVGIITGKTIGEGKEELMREYARTVQILFLALGLITGLTLFILRGPFISLYNVSPSAVKEAKRLIAVLSVSAVGTCYQAACLSGLVKSGGDISFVFKNDAIFVFLIVIPSALTATRLGAAAWIVFAALKCDQILKCIVAAVKINRFNWMKNLTRDG